MARKACLPLTGRVWGLLTWMVLSITSASIAAEQTSSSSRASDETRPVISLRAWGVPTGFGVGLLQQGARQVVDAFRKEYPWIDPVSTTGLVLPGSRATSMVTFMQIAGDMAPDVIFVNFHQSQTYIDMGLLHPLDHYVEALAGVTIPDGHRMDNEQYLAQLRQGPNCSQIEDRVPAACWAVMRRRDPAGSGYHTYAFPVGPLAVVMQYDRTLLSEHAGEGMELRTPRDWDELLRWARLLTNPKADTYGLQISTSLSGWTFANLLYAAGGNVVEEDASGQWRCVLDSDAAVEAGYFWARLRLENVVRDGRVVCRGVIKVSESVSRGDPTRYGFRLVYLDDQFFAAAIDQTRGLGPMPAGPTGLRRSEFNARMLGIFSGLANQPQRRDAAWAYIQFYDGTQARKIRMERMVEAGLGPYVRRELLEQFNADGRYDSVIRRIPQGLTSTYQAAFAGGVPEPYGKNCQSIYDEMARPLGAIWNSGVIQDALDRGDEAAAKTEIRGILRRAAAQINQKMLGHLPPPIAVRRTRVAWVVIAAVVLIFFFMLRQVFKVFTPPHQRGALAASGRNAGGRRCLLHAWILMAPALGLIAMWKYWPMLAGTAIAFQDYNVLGDSRWVGATHFATALFSGEFWYAMRVSLYYSALFLVFGFWVPIGLALLLSEVPRGKVLFRTIYYLPAVLSGVVVIFLWRTFYRPEGLVDQTLNVGVWLLNLLPGVSLDYLRHDWLQDPRFALLCCLLPTVWAGMGPGCLIYLAALKTVSDDLYEAADIDGAGIGRKLFHVAMPSIKMLVLINFIGAMIGAFRGAGGFVLAMTGGGPYGESGGATEVIGLKIFYTTFGYLQFGLGAAMAWILGSMLIGFTVLQLMRLSRIEFRAVESV